VPQYDRLNDLLQIGKFEICSPRIAHASACQLCADGSTILYLSIFPPEENIAA
jgi:hypothetical protein